MTNEFLQDNPRGTSMVHMDRNLKPTLITNGQVKLGFGDIVAFAGDFYEHPQARAQISNNQIRSFGNPGSNFDLPTFVHRFEEAFNTLWSADTNEMKKVVAAYNIELNELRKSKSNAGYVAADHLEGSTLGQYRNQQFSIATRMRGSSLIEDEDLENVIAKLSCALSNDAVTKEVLQSAFFGNGT